MKRPFLAVTMTLNLHRLLFTGLLLLTICLQSHAQQKRNVLFIAVDDLRPELGCYGRDYMKTPNIDALASRGVLFEKAYCMVPTCGASRASVMSSRRPAPTRFRNYLTWLSKEVPDAKPLHSLFKDNGYTTIGIGKIFHHAKDHADGWSEKALRPKQRQWFDKASEQTSMAQYKAKYPDSKKGDRGPSTESAEVEDSLYGDGESADAAIEKLGQFSKTPDQPFFLALGFYKPHLPFNAPKKYWDLYDRNEIDFTAHDRPANTPKNAFHTSGELRAYSDIPPQGPVSNEKAKELIHGYRACVSFIDAQLGRVMAKLEETGLANNTIVVLWSDHGWQLGDHGMWNKHSCFETSMWTPLIISVPGEPAIQQGQRASGLVELIDLYPTICELASVKPPAEIDGSSLVTQLKDPTIEGKPFAIGRYQFGDTIRTKDFRYTEFRGKAGGKQGKGPVGLGFAFEKMMFNHASDPDEHNNVVDEERFAEVTKRLSEELNANKGVPYQK